MNAKWVEGVAVGLPALTLVEAPPATVTQYTGERHFGLPGAVFKRLCADGKLPAKRLGRTWVVGYEEGRHALAERAEREGPGPDEPRAPLAPPGPPPPADDGAYAVKMLA